MLGVPVRALYSLAEIGERHALRVAVVSLAGTLNVGLVADPTLLPDVGGLAGGMQAEGGGTDRPPAASLTGAPAAGGTGPPARIA